MGVGGSGKEKLENIVPYIFHKNIVECVIFIFAHFITTFIEIWYTPFLNMMCRGVSVFFSRPRIRSRNSALRAMNNSNLTTEKIV